MPPNIPSQAQIIARCAADFRAEAEVNPLRRSPEYALIRAQAGQSKGLYTFLEFLFNQAFPGTAEDSYFWRWAAIWEIFQKDAEPWTGTVRMTGVVGTDILDGTVLSRSDGALYQVVGDWTIAEEGDPDYVDVDVEALEGGTESNLDPGDPLTAAVSLTDVDSDCTVQSTTIDGSDLEEAEDGLVRLLSRIRSPSSGGGTSGDYVNWALEVGGVTRAWESSPAPGDVTIAFVRDNDGTGADILPSAGELDEVETYVQGEAPITVEVSALPLTALLIEVTISNLVPDTTAVRNAIEASIEDLFVREAEPGGTIYRSRLVEAIANATGETSHTLVSPAADVVAAADEIPIYDGLVVT